MLVCNYNIDKVPVKLFAFHQKVFLSWPLIYNNKLGVMVWAGISYRQQTQLHLIDGNLNAQR
jgi:hypothetical protein